MLHTFHPPHQQFFKLFVSQNLKIYIRRNINTVKKAVTPEIYKYTTLYKQVLNILTLKKKKKIEKKLTYVFTKSRRLQSIQILLR